jgi:hypothetical protein
MVAAIRLRIARFMMVIRRNEKVRFRLCGRCKIRRGWRSKRKCRLEFSAVAHLRCGSRRSGRAGVDFWPRPGFRIAAGLHVGAQMPDESDSTRTAQRVGTRKVT